MAQQQRQRFQRQDYDPQNYYRRPTELANWGAAPNPLLSNPKSSGGTMGKYVFSSNDPFHITHTNLPKDFKYKNINQKIGDNDNFRFHRIDDLRSDKAKKRIPKVKWQNEKLMQPLIDLVLNNKKEIKYNPRLTTADGAAYWINKNRLKNWRVKEEDVNPEDGKAEDEVVIYNSAGIPVWINGYSLKPARAGIDRLYQNKYPMGYDIANQTRVDKKKWKNDMFQIYPRENPWGATYVGDPNPAVFQTLRAQGYNAPRAPPIYLSPSQVWSKVFCECLKSYSAANTWNDPVYILNKLVNRMSIASIFFMVYVDYAWFLFLKHNNEFKDINAEDMTWEKYKSRTNRKKQRPTKYDFAAIFFYIWMREGNAGSQFLLDKNRVVAMINNTKLVGNDTLANMINDRLPQNWEEMKTALNNKQHPNHSFIKNHMKIILSDCMKDVSEMVKGGIITQQLPIPNDAEYFADMQSTKLEDWDDVITDFKNKRPLDEDEYGRLEYKMPQPRYRLQRADEDEAPPVVQQPPVQQVLVQQPPVQEQLPNIDRGLYEEAIRELGRQTLLQLIRGESKEDAEANLEQAIRAKRAAVAAANGNSPPPSGIEDVNDSGYDNDL